MSKSYDSYEIYVSPAGIRICSAGWDQPFAWDRAESAKLEYCKGHGTEPGPEAVTAGVKPEGTQDRD